MSTSRTDSSLATGSYVWDCRGEECSRNEQGVGEHERVRVTEAYLMEVPSTQLSFAPNPFNKQEMWECLGCHEKYPTRAELEAAPCAGPIGNHRNVGRMPVTDYEPRGKLAAMIDQRISMIDRWGWLSSFFPSLSPWLKDVLFKPKREREILTCRSCGSTGANRDELAAKYCRPADTFQVGQHMVVRQGKGGLGCEECGVGTSAPRKLKDTPCDAAEIRRLGELARDAPPSWGAHEYDSVRESQHYLECAIARRKGKPEPLWSHKGVM